MKYEKLNHEPEVNLLHDFISKNEIHKLKIVVKVLFSKLGNVSALSSAKY